jgi:hypothetical protein
MKKKKRKHHHISHVFIARGDPVRAKPLISSVRANNGPVAVLAWAIAALLVAAAALFL